MVKIHKLCILFRTSVINSGAEHNHFSGNCTINIVYQSNLQFGSLAVCYLRTAPTRAADLVYFEWALITLQNLFINVDRIFLEVLI